MKDLHRERAAKLFGIKPEEVTDEQRRLGKERNYIDAYSDPARRPLNLDFSHIEQRAIAWELADKARLARRFWGGVLVGVGATLLVVAFVWALT